MTTLRLSDLQLVLLSAAAQRDDGSLLPPPDSIGERTPASTRPSNLSSDAAWRRNSIHRMSTGHCRQTETG